jgi:steroid delta-isomerase-like uncharacterized protein
MTFDAQLAAAREAVVREHMDSENRHDFEATLATFDHPRYELIGTGDTYDGEAAVRRYFEETRTAFPDQRNTPLALYVSADAVTVELLLEGTHLGMFRGLPPTRRAFRCTIAAVFLFAPGSARITCERVYFDVGTILRQLGIAYDPRSLRGRVATALNHPFTVGRALVRHAVRSLPGRP